MTVPIVLLSCNILVFMGAFATIGFVANSWKMPSIRWLTILVSSFCVVSFCTLGVYIARDIETQIIFSRMRFLTLGLLAPSWLMFLSSIYQKPKWLQLPVTSLIVFTPGLITTVLTIVPAWRDYILKDFSSLKIGQFTVLQFDNGAWFQYHYFWTMCLVASSLALGIYLFFKEKGLRRHQILILTVCSVLAAAVDIYCVLLNPPMRWLMLASGTFFISLLGIIFSTVKLKLLNVTTLALGKVFQEFPDPVIVIDGDKTIRMANKTSGRFFDLNNLQGRKICEALPQINLVEGEIALLDHNGEKHFFNLCLEKLETDVEHSSGQVIFFRQITLQKSIEKRLNENLEFKARLLSLITHDFMGQIEAQTLVSASLHEDVIDSSIKDKLDLLTTSTSASQGFMENVLSWVKSQKDNFEVINKDFEWNTLVKECIEEQSSLCKMKNIIIEFQSDSWPLIGQGDSNMLASVIRNLLTNAIRATNNAQSIKINLYSSNQVVKVEIIDFGVGMNEDVLQKIRNLSSSFVFVNESQSEFGSFGIGLMIVKHFLSLHRGELFIESTLNQGTVVSFEIK